MSGINYLAEKPALSCFSGCIYNVLKYDKIYIEEKEIYKSPMLLNLILHKQLGIRGKIDYICKQWILNNNLAFRELNIKDIIELKKALVKYKRLIINCECHTLKYNKVFQQNITCQNRHYIMVYEGINGKINICDSFVPTSMISVYEGELENFFDFPDGCNFYLLETDKFVGNKERVLAPKEIGEIIKNFEKCNINHIFETARKMIISNRDNKLYFYECATSIITGGVYLSRKMFYEYIKDMDFITQQEKENVLEISNKYIQLRFLFLKYYLQTNQQNIENIINMLFYIQAKERETYERINRNIRTAKTKY